MKVSLRSLSFSWSEVMRAAAQLDLSSGRGMPPISQNTNSFLISRMLLCGHVSSIRKISCM